MFKFGFSVDPNGDENTTKENEEVCEKLDWIQCKEIFSPFASVDEIDTKDVRTFSSGDCILSHLPPDNAEKQILKDVKEIEHSDLLPAKYEGGLKIWECTIDLIRFLQLSSEIINFSDKKVLDLGCGTGLVGIFALLQGASVHFQDYNDAVISMLTIPNVMLNSNEKESSLQRCRFFAGDWESFGDLVDERYDYILTSETIYNPENHGKIYSVLKKTLKETGTAFVAAKTYYFGVGGGISQFQGVLKKEDIFKSSVVWEWLDGVKRKILRVTFKKRPEEEKL